MDARTKKVSLAFMGDGWAECYVEMRFMRWDDYKHFSEIETKHDDNFVDAMVEKIQHVFVAGQVLDGGKPTELTADAIHEFDVEALKTLNNAALGYPDPKE